MGTNYFKRSLTKVEAVKFALTNACSTAGYSRRQSVVVISLVRHCRLADCLLLVVTRSH